jgi:hypothetical protein
MGRPFFGGGARGDPAELMRGWMKWSCIPIRTDQNPFGVWPRSVELLSLRGSQSSVTAGRMIGTRGDSHDSGEFKMLGIAVPPSFAAASRDHITQSRLNELSTEPAR